MDQKTDEWLTGMPPGTNNSIDQDPTDVEFNTWRRWMPPESNDFTAGPNRHAAGTGIDGRSLNPGLMIGEELQYQSTSTLEAQTAGMANVHNSSSMNILQAIDQLAGSSQPSKDQSGPKKLAEKRSDLKNSEKMMQEIACMKRKVNEIIEKDKAYEKKVDRLEKNLEQNYKKQLSELKVKVAAQTAAITEMAQAIAENRPVDVQLGNQQLKIAMLEQTTSEFRMKIADLESEAISRQLRKKMKTED